MTNARAPRAGQFPPPTSAIALRIGALQEKIAV